VQLVDLNQAGPEALQGSIEGNYLKKSLQRLRLSFLTGSKPGNSAGCNHKIENE
jgi:hypothetical protein